MVNTAQELIEKTEVFEKTIFTLIEMFEKDTGMSVNSITVFTNGVTAGLTLPFKDKTNEA